MAAQTARTDVSSSRPAFLGLSHPTRKRALKACSCCRERKVRCDVTDCGSPCTNCRLDRQVCVVREHRKRKRKTDRGIAEASNAVLSAATAPHVSWGDTYNNTVPSLHRDLNDTPALELESGTTNLESHPLYRSHDNIDLQGHDHLADLLATGFPVPASSHTTQEHVENHEIPRHVDDGLSSQLPEIRADYLPRFIKPPQTRVSSNDFDYLGKKGALDVPDTVLRNELLRCYVEHVHGYMPLLDLQDFLQIIDRGDGETGQVSLLLFQCVMFAGASFVDLHHLICAGYPTRKFARKALFQKARLLYDLDYEIDPISIVQSLLLMTFWSELRDDRKDIWYWMGVASDFSLRIGLHDELLTKELTTKERRLLRRISWSCFMRDQFVSLGVQRPPRINRQEHYIPMLSLDDFDFDPLPINITCVSSDCVIARNANYLKALALMCIEKAKLCVCISHIISTQYTVPFHRQGLLGPDGSPTATNWLTPRKDDSQSAEADLCDIELQEWYTNLPEETRYKPASDIDLSNGDCAIMIHLAFLQLFYYTAVIVLHRSRLLLAAQQESTHRKIQQAAWETTAIAEELTRLDLIQYIPSYGTTVILQAVMTHVTDMKSGDTAARKKSFAGFCVCVAFMQKLRCMHHGADSILTTLEGSIRKVATSNSSSFQSRPGPIEMADFFEHSAPQNDLIATLKGFDHHGATDEGNEYIPPYSSGWWDLANEVVTGNIHAQGKSWLDFVSGSGNLSHKYDFLDLSSVATLQTSKKIHRQQAAGESSMDMSDVRQLSISPKDDVFGQLLVEIEQLWPGLQ